METNHLARVISHDDILNMLHRAAHSVTDWEKRSKINERLSIGYTWNLIALPILTGRKTSNLVTSYRILLSDFSEYLPKSAKEKYLPVLPKKRELPKMIHQEPNLNWNKHES